MSQFDPTIDLPLAAPPARVRGRVRVPGWLLLLWHNRKSRIGMLMVASMVILRARITLVNISSQMVQVLGFIRLGRTPKTRNGAEITPRIGTGTCICSQQPMQNLECCKAAI